MNYDVLEESKNALNNLENTAWENHDETYIQTKAAIEEFKEQIEDIELQLKEATTQEEKDEAQKELTAIINDIQDFKESFKSELQVVDDKETLPAEPEDVKKDIQEEKKDLDTKAIDDFINSLNN